MYKGTDGKYVFEEGENEPSSAGLSFGPIPSRVASSKKAKAVENWDDGDGYEEDDEEDI